MNMPVKKIVIVAIVVFVCAVAGWKIKSAKSEAVAATVPQLMETAQTTLAAAENVTTDHHAFKDVEDNREQYLEEKRQADELAKKLAQKEKSVECVFWRQQKKLGKSTQADEKVTQYCTL